MSTNCVKCVVAPRVDPGLLCAVCAKEDTTKKKAMAAIRHILHRVKDDPYFAYYMEGTESLNLLTEAAADLWDKPVFKVREMFQPLSIKQPKETS